MLDKLHKAIRNNLGLYEAVFRVHNLHHHQITSIWYCLEKTPPLYANLISLSQVWQPDEIFKKIDQLFEKEAWASWSIKDSFGVLDLRNEGFTNLFDGHWINLDVNNFSPSLFEPQLNYRIVKNPAELSSWRLAWDPDELLGKQIFDVKMLFDESVKFIAGYEGDEIVCGCLLNKTDDVLGVSNFFPFGEEIKYWPEMLSFIHRSIEKVDIVGYERQETAKKLALLGFEILGNLTVFIKKRHR